MPPDLSKPRYNKLHPYSDIQDKKHFSVYMKKYFPLLGLYAVIFPESYDFSEAAAKAVRRYLYNVSSSYSYRRSDRPSDTM